MSATFYDLQKFAKTGVASAGMTNFDKLRAIAMFGGDLMRTITGVPPLQFFGYGEPLISYQIYGNMTQNGTPTPDDPIFPQECGDRTDNLIDTNDPTAINNAYINGSGIIMPSGGWWVSGYIPIEQGERYTAKNVSERYLFYSKKGGTSTFINSDPDYGFTVPDGVKYVRVWGRKNSVMLVKGSTVPSSYEPYGYKIPITCGGVTQNIYLDEPLRKIGDYADEVKSDGTAVRKIKKIVLDGTENWQALWGVLSLGLSTAADTTPRTITVMCDRYNAKGNLLQAQGYPSHYGDCSITFRDYNSSLMIRDDRYGTDTAAYKSYLADQYAAGTPVTIWYVLAEDQVEAVTLPQIPTISGQNTLSFGTALQPSSVSVTGHIKPVTS